MNRLFKNFLVFLILIPLVGCNEEINDSVTLDPQMNYLYIKGPDGIWSSNGNNMDVNPQRGDYVFSLHSSFSAPGAEVYTWNSTYPPYSWFDVKFENDSKIRLIIDENNSIKERKGGISLVPTNKGIKESSFHDYRVQISIKQQGRSLAIYENEISIMNGKTITLSRKSESSSIYEVRADGDYTITKDSKDTWFDITHSKDNNTFFITASKNPTNVVREGLLTVSLSGLPEGESMQIELKVNQSAGESAPEFLYTPGNSNGWDFNDTGRLKTDDYSNYFGFSHLIGEFKITTAPSWNGIIWGSGGEGKLDSSGGANNLTVSEDGLYWLEVNLDNETYTMDKVNSISLTADAKDNFEMNDITLNPSADMYVWSTNVTLNKGDRWKFQINFNNKPSFTLGGNSGILGEDDGFLEVTDNGTFKITVNFTTLPYTYTINKQ